MALDGFVAWRKHLVESMVKIAGQLQHEGGRPVR
jgi:hypothetical protein